LNFALPLTPWIARFIPSPFMKIPENVRAWIRTRLASAYFGRRFSFRMDLYAQFTAVMLIFLLVWIYTKAMGDEDELLSLQLSFWLTLLLLVVWGFVYALVLAVKAATNSELASHELLLFYHRISAKESLRVHRGHSSRDTSIDDSASFGERSLPTSPSPPFPRVAEGVAHGVTTPDTTRGVSDGMDTGSGGQHGRASIGAASKSDVDGKSGLERRKSWAEDIFNVFQSVETPIQTQCPECNHRPSADHSLSNSSSDGVDPTEHTPKLQAGKLAGIVYSDARREELGELLATASEAIELTSRLIPIRFLGVDACWGFFSSYGSAWAFVVFFTVSLAGLDLPGFS